MNQPDRATLKQVAYLTYLGVPNAEHLTKQEASDRINTLLETEEVKRKNWVSDRLNLHPQLYDRELAEELSNSLHGYVRSRVVGASDDLTKKKIEAVVFALTKNDGYWWQIGEGENCLRDLIAWRKKAGLIFLGVVMVIVVVVIVIACFSRN